MVDSAENGGEVFGGKRGGVGDEPGRVGEEAENGFEAIGADDRFVGGGYDGEVGVFRRIGFGGAGDGLDSVTRQAGGAGERFGDGGVFAGDADDWQGSDGREGRAGAPTHRGDTGENRGAADLEVGE